MGVTVVVLCDRDRARAEEAAAAIGRTATAASWRQGVLDGCDVLVLATPVEPDLVKRTLAARVAVVSVADGIGDVEGLLSLDRLARSAGTVLAVGAGMAPGLSDVLARHAALDLDVVEEIHIAKAGTAGPACARQHHHALSDEALDWREGAWVRRPGGSGRELCWFPDPVGGRDCYRAGLADALLVVPAFPGVRRVTARVAATRRDRLTSALPMLRPPHPEGEIGAVRVEVRGSNRGARRVRILGAVDRPGAAAGAVAAVSALWAVAGRLTRTGAAGLGELVGEPAAFLAELARRGVNAAVFEGSGCS
ncbi:MAG: saccharopine dehydrogenase family protein [Acidimicrobiales bacterium]